VKSTGVTFLMPVNFGDMAPDLVYRIALTMVPQLGPVQAKILLQHLEPEEIFRAKRSTLEKIEGIGSVRADAIFTFNDYTEADDEIRFLDKQGIQPLFITDPGYPQRLLNCYDSPTLLYYKGMTALNTSKVIAIVGTRSNTGYGRQVTEALVQELAPHDVLIISGLAIGIDAIAHKAALKNNMSTVGVLAHGLDQVYPYEHNRLAREMITENGGILTEFRQQSKPDRHNFPSRNRIVAGMSDATIVIETGVKGGSMITADLANGYNKDVFAIPGKISDPKSSGCNYLIKNNKAVLLPGAEDLLEMMGWRESLRNPPSVWQKELFIELNPAEKNIVELLKGKEFVHVDELHLQSGLSNSMVAAALLNLELNNIIAPLPGKMYRLC
jgi:DNA processing protein